jgi:hypothetical protein
MIEYIYFVKCPNCEDEHFYFFDEAKECAMRRLSQKPVITQTEVNRNDFGECTDSCDLGTVWSWEDTIKDVPVDSEQATFSKADTIECDNCFDQEFDNLDNSLEPITEETEACTLGFYDRETQDQVLVSFYSFADADEYVASHEGVRDLYTDPKYTSENYLKHINKYRKPVPEGMSIKELVEAMEENEDEVECALCNELFPKAECHYDEEEGYICAQCEEDTVKCTWCGFHYDPGECRKEVDLGWLCRGCEMAIKSRGETLTFREGSYWDLLDEDYSKDPSDLVELEYPNLTVTLFGPKRDVDDWDEIEHTTSHTFLVPKVEVATAIWENWITEEDVKDVEGGLEALEDDIAWEKFLETHFDNLFEQYQQQILKYFEEDAVEDFREKSQEEYDLERWTASNKPKSYLEDLEEPDDYKARLADCPECGATQSFDHETGICVNCGFNV